MTDTWIILIIFENSSVINLGPRTLDDFFSFFEIPATATFFENVSEKDRKQIIKVVRKKLKDKFVEIDNNKWIYFTFKKR